MQLQRKSCGQQRDASIPLDFTLQSTVALGNIETILASSITPLSQLGVQVGFQNTFRHCVHLNCSTLWNRCWKFLLVNRVQVINVVKLFYVVVKIKLTNEQGRRYVSMMKGNVKPRIAILTSSFSNSPVFGSKTHAWILGVV